MTTALFIVWFVGYFMARIDNIFIDFIKGLRLSEGSKLALVVALAATNIVILVSMTAALNWVRR